MGILDLIFPKYCLTCGTPGKYMCGVCLEKVGRGKPPGIFDYEGVIRKAILALKYKFAYDIASELANACVAQINQSTNQPINPVLIPVPLHQSRKNWRGFNQSELVGKLVADKMDWGYEPNLLVRSQASKAQVGLPKRERLRNICGKFAAIVSREALPGVAKGYAGGAAKWDKYSIIIFDDVYTTGATLLEVKKALGDAGFTKIYLLTIAR